jgi:hypothetical protein
LRLKTQSKKLRALEVGTYKQLRKYYKGPFSIALEKKQRKLAQLDQVSYQKTTAESRACLFVRATTQTEKRKRLQL